MKKLLSIFIVSLMFVGLAWAQGTLTFDEPEVNLTTSYSDGSFAVGGVTWNYGHSRDQETYPIDGVGLLLRRASDSFLEATIPGGVGTFSFQYRKAYTGATNRNLELIVNDTQVHTSGNFGGSSGAQDTVYDFTYDVNTAGNVYVKIKLVGTASGNAQTVLDNIAWTAFGDAPPEPLLSVSPLNLDGFFYTVGSGPSEVQSFAIQGSYLAGDIDVVAGGNFEISLSETGTFSDALTLDAINDEVENTTIYVRMAAGLDVGNITGNITVSTLDSDDKIVTLAGEVYALPPADGYFVDFEGAGEVKTGYASGTVNLSGLDWDMTQALIGVDDADFRNGARSVRFNGKDGSSMTMLEDKANGLGTLSFEYRRYGATDAQVDWVAEYSTDQGATWTQIGSEFTATSDVQEFNEAVNVAGDVRIRIIVVNPHSQNRRLNIDDIFLSDFTGGMPVVASPAFDPAGGHYTSPVSVSISTITDGATIRYTLDGSNPGESDGEIYTAPIEISADTTLKAIAYKVDHLNSSISTAAYTFPAPPTVVANIAELRAGATDGTVYVLSGEAILTYQNSNRNTKYIQDDTAAIVIDDYVGGVAAITTEYDLYDGITGITGYLNLYSGLLQFVPTADPGAATSSNNVVVPELRTITSLTPADQAKLVKIEGLHFDGAPENFGAGAENLTLSDGVNTITLRTFPNTDYSNTAIPTDDFDLIAVVGQFNTAMQVNARFLADFITTSYDVAAGEVIPVDTENTIEITGGGFLGADYVPTNPEDYSPFPNAAFTPTLRGKWHLYGSGMATITVSTFNDWFAWLQGGNWNTLQGPFLDETITVNLDAKDAFFEFMAGDGTNPTLPVELSYFNAVYMVESSSVLLSWKTESETQMLGYRLYRSSDNDLENALLITPKMIEATNSSTGGEYSHNDINLENGNYYYWLEAISYNSSDYYGYQNVIVENPVAPQLPNVSKMSNAYPNPFRGNTSIDLEIKQGESGYFTIYNLLGQAVYSQNLSEGNITVKWNGTDKNGNRLGSGVYFYKLTTPSTSQTKKMVIMK